MRFERIVISFALASTALATACEIEKHQPSSSNNEDTNSATPTSPSVSDAQPSALPEFSDASSVDAPADAVADEDASFAESNVDAGSSDAETDAAKPPTSPPSYASSLTPIAQGILSGTTTDFSEVTCNSSLRADSVSALACPEGWTHSWTSSEAYFYCVKEDVTPRSISIGVEIGRDASNQKIACLHSANPNNPSFKERNWWCITLDANGDYVQQDAFDRHQRPYEEDWKWRDKIFQPSFFVFSYDRSVALHVSEHAVSLTYALYGYPSARGCGRFVYFSLKADLSSALTPRTVPFSP